MMVTYNKDSFKKHLKNSSVIKENLMTEESISNDLNDAMQTLHATNFCFYWNVHNAHWDIEGKDFPYFHDFFSKLYEDLFDQVDTISEHIRTLDLFPENDLSQIIKKSNIKSNKPLNTSSSVLSKEIYSENKILLDTLSIAQKSAESANQIGLSNYLQDRIDAHKKYDWMLRSITKG